MLDQVLGSSSTRLISIDIFDTLLFRTVRTPHEVFELMFESKPELFPTGFDKVEWRNIRINMEIEARRRKYVDIGHREVILQEIYDELPAVFFNPDLLMGRELKTEKEVCFVNPRIESIIRHIKTHSECIIVLVSDMYLSQDYILTLLKHVGFDVSLVHEVFMSCEQQVSKAEGKLFQIILQKYGISAQDMLHIGDNILADVAIPEKLGIQTIHYDLISNSENRHPFLELETLKFNSVLPEVHALRNLAADMGRKLPENERPWHELGAMILGPLFTFLAEWVLDIAEENKIDKIYPLMREGEFLSIILKNAARYRQKKLDIRPLFVSRMALFLPSLHVEGFGTEHVEYLLNSHDITIGDVFKVLEIDDVESFQDWLGLSMSDARKITYENVTISSKLKNYLLSEDICSQVKNNSEAANKLLTTYLSAQGFTSAAITLDIGCRGTMQHCLDRVLRSAGNDESVIHLIVMGNDKTLKPIFDNVDIRGLLGLCGRNRLLLSQLMVRIIELFMMCDTGTTTGYTEDTYTVTPVLEEIIYPNSQQMQQIKWVQKGVYDFQEVYYLTGQYLPRVKALKHSTDQLTMPLARLFSAPLGSEAAMLGQWHYDENFGAQRMWKVIKSEQLKSLQKKGLDGFLNEQVERHMEWFPGMLSSIDTYYHLKRYHAERNYFHKLKRVLYAEKIIQECSPEQSIIIAGAGEAGRDVYSYLLMGRPELKVEAFIDNNPKLHGLFIQGIPVCSFSDDFDSSVYVIGSLEYEKEIFLQIRREKGLDVRIINYSFTNIITQGIS